MPPEDPITDLFPLVQRDGRVCYMSQREVVGELAELAARGIMWLVAECPAALALAAAGGIGIWLLAGSDGPKGRRR
jgi:hypothetical protein